MHQQPRIQKILIISISYITNGVLGIYLTMYQYTVFSLSKFFQVNVAMMGIMIGMHEIGMIAPVLFFSNLFGRIGKKKALLIAFFLIILGTFLESIMQSYCTFIISVFIVGVGFSATEATTCSLLTDEFPNETTKHLNFSQVTFSIGALAGPFIAEWLISCGIYFKELFLYVSILFLILGLISIFIRVQNINKKVIRKNNFNLFKFLNKKTFLLLSLAIFLYVGIESTIGNFTDRYYQLVLGKPQLSVLALTLFWGSMIPSRILAGFVRIDKKKIFITLSSLIFVTTTSAMLISDYTIKIILFALCGFSCGPIWPLIMDTVASKVKGSTVSAFNVMLAFSGLGGTTLPVAAGIIANIYNQQSGFYLCGISAVIMIIIYVNSLKDPKTENKKTKSIYK